MLDRLVDFLLQFVELFQFWAVLEPYEQGVRIRLGKGIKVLGPGFHWRLPMKIDRIIFESVVMKTKSLGAVSTTTADGKQVGFEVVVSYKVNDIETALLKVYEVDDAIKDACAGTVGQFLSSVAWAEMNTQETADKLTAACRKRGWKYGVEVMSVQLAGVSLVRNIRLMNSGHVAHL
jgi:regulator of protease activity HflC (stomatin/prohibitin superfamily)